MQVPDSIRPTLELILKHHFWILAVIVPIALIPALFAAQGSLVEKIDEKQAEIDGRLSSLQGVQKQQPHPAEGWVTAIHGATESIRRETLQEWKGRWQRQQERFQWPKALGEDFLRQASRLKPDGSLSRPLLERYQNGIRGVVRTIPEALGAEERMLDTTNRGGGPGDGGMGLGGVGLEGPGMGFGGVPGPGRDPAGGRAAANQKQRAIEWNSADQQQLYQSFDWKRPPSTTQVIVAQEELWLYRLLCECIAKVNAGAGGQYNAAIPYLHELKVGYPAAEEKPWGEGESRVMRPAAAPGGDGMMGGMGGMEAGGMGGAERPPNPRFAGLGQRSGGGMGSMDSMADAAAEDDESTLLNWAYVSFDGKPLAAGEVDSTPEAKLMRFVPFRMKMLIDQRKLDALLGVLATAALPVDVRQVRINPDSASRSGRQGLDQMEGGPSFGGGGGFGGGGDQRPTGGRVFDAVVEVRGSIAVLRPPDPSALGIEPDAAVEAAAPSAMRPARLPQGLGRNPSSRSAAEKSREGIDGRSRPTARVPPFQVPRLQVPRHRADAAGRRMADAMGRSNSALHALLMQQKEVAA